MFEFFGDRFFQPYKINRNSIIESCDYKRQQEKKKVSIHFKYFIPISIAKKVEILYLPLTLASLANVVSILIDNKLRQLYYLEMIDNFVTSIFCNKFFILVKNKKLFL